MGALTITVAGVRLLCGITDTSQDANIAALVALAQPTLEYALDPAVLAYTPADAGLLATLTLGGTEVVAGEYVAALGRGLTAQGLLAAQALNAAVGALAGDEEGGTKFVQQTFKVGTLEVSARPLFDHFRPEVTRADLVKIGLELAGRGLARLAPFSRSARSLARSAVGTDAGLGAQTAAPLLLGSAPLGSAPPADATFDAVLGVDGATEPPGGDVAAFPPFGGWPGGAP